MKNSSEWDAIWDKLIKARENLRPVPMIGELATLSDSEKQIIEIAIDTIYNFSKVVSDKLAEARERYEILHKK